MRHARPPTDMFSITHPSADLKYTELYLSMNKNNLRKSVLLKRAIANIAGANGTVHGSQKCSTYSALTSLCEGVSMYLNLHGADTALILSILLHIVHLPE